MQMSEQAFWLSDLTRNMADLSEQHETGNENDFTLFFFHSNSIDRVSDACFMFVGEKKKVLSSVILFFW